MNTDNLSDKELLRLMYAKVVSIEEEVHCIKEDVNELKLDIRDLKITVYGDERKGIKGLQHHVDALRNGADYLKKWKFAVGVVVGFVSFIYTAYIGFKELMRAINL